MSSTLPLLAVTVAALAIVQQATAAPAFQGKAVTRTGVIRLHGGIDKVFPLFGPIEEKHWAAGWEPRVVYFAGPGEVAEGMVFITGDNGETTWVLSHYDPAGHAIAYYNVTPAYQLRKIEIRCRPLPGEVTEATVTYTHVGLSDRGNQDVEHMNEAAYAEKMASWEKAINHYLKTGTTLPHH
ncbi:MAG: hypothetical protein ACR2IF_16505 [Terriglobales bacterium]